MTRTALAFSIADIRLALDAAFVQEVLPSVRLVQAPEMPPLVRGFIALHRTLVPVIRLELLLEKLGATVRTQAPAPSEASLDLSDHLILARLADTQVAWAARGQDIEPLTYRTSETIPLPENHLLNNCARQMIPSVPPAILLEADKLLLASERLRLEQLTARAADRSSLLADAEPSTVGMSPP